MKRKLFRYILVITVSLAISSSSAYICYYAVASADFISHNLKLERFDQEFLSASNQNELKAFGFGGFFDGSSLVAYPIGVSLQSLFEISSFGQKTLILRC